MRQITARRATSQDLRRRDDMDNNYSKIFSFIGIILLLLAVYSFLFLHSGQFFILFLLLCLVSYFVFTLLSANEISRVVKRAGYAEIEKGGMWKVPVYSKKIGSVLLKLRAGLVSRRSTFHLYELFTDNPSSNTFTIRNQESTELQKSIFKIQDKLENKAPLLAELEFIKHIPELNSINGRWTLTGTPDLIVLTITKSNLAPLEINAIIKSEEQAILAIYSKLKSKQ